MGANTSEADFLKRLGRAKSRGSSQLYKKSPNAAGFTIWQDFFFDQISGATTTSQAQTVVASGSFAALSGVSGTVATSQAQTISASGSSAVANVTGAAALSQAQTVAGTGSASVASVSGTAATSQAQTIVSSGSSSPASVGGVATTSQAETIAGSGSFAGAGVVSGDVATSQAQTVTGTGEFTSATVTPSGEVILERKKRYYVRKNGKILLFDTANEADAFIESDAKAEEVAKTKTSRLARKRVRDVVIADFKPEIVDLKLTELLSEKFDIPNLLQFVELQDWDKVLEIQSLAIEMEEEENEALLFALP